MYTCSCNFYAGHECRLQWKDGASLGSGGIPIDSVLRAATAVKCRPTCSQA